MILKKSQFRARNLLYLSIALSLLMFAPASASNYNSEWVIFEGGAVRLLRDDTANPAQKAVGALEFRLEDGWHIYWRYPGETGLPTTVDFSASTNLKDYHLQYPPPQIYNDGLTQSLIYKKKVILPISWLRQNPKRPAVLDASIEFGVCKHICIPEHVSLSLVIPRVDNRSSEWKKIIAQALLQVPTPMARGDAFLKSAKKVEVDGQTHWDFTFALERTSGASNIARHLQLFIDGGPSAYHGIPKLIETTANTARFRVNANGLKDGRVLFTLVNGKHSYQANYTIPLDASQSK